MGRLPKPPGTRLRRNALSPAEEFLTLPTIEEAKKFEVPPIPKRPGRGNRQWGKSVKRWWQEVWKTPMAKMWRETGGISTVSDLLLLRQDMIDAKTVSERLQVMKMARTYEAVLGMTELDRRRLRWVIPGEARQQQDQEPEAPKMTPEETRVVPAPVFSDPRRALGSVHEGLANSSNGRGGATGSS